MNINYNIVIVISMMFLKESNTQKCDEKNTCKDCIQTKGCAWCSKVKDEIYASTSLISKCHQSEKILEICQQGFIENPKAIMKIIKNRPMKNGAHGNTIQIRPQEIFIKLKPEEEFTIDMEFKKAENYPVDLYYLMDFSSSMSKHKNNLSKLGNKLAETMKNLTTDFQLGFGSFVDKVVLPFTSTLPSHLLHPCPKCSPPYSFKNHMSLTRETKRFSGEVGKARLSGNIDTPEGTLDALMQTIVSSMALSFLFVLQILDPRLQGHPGHKMMILLHPCPKCSPPYSFKNHMSLTRETKRFSGEVGKARLSGNIDTPEGTLDALMQTIVCQKELNWREKARHIIVVSTDAPFHLAGDGKLGGVIEPHDELCHLNEEGDYTHSLIFDYPSVSQISHKALDFNMNIIFAVVNKVKNDYLGLSKEIRGSSLGLLDAGENIADLIKAQYEKITTTVRLTDNAQWPIHISYSALCNKTEKWKISNECKDMKGGSVAYFRLHILVSDCSIKKRKITVKPVGMNETLTISLETICDCECSFANHPANEINSKFCSYSGDLICGLCACRKGRIGKNCECSGTDEKILNITDTEGCISNNMTNEICSGHGECKCGLCQCYRTQNPKEQRTGKLCECDNYSCKRIDEMMCSGHGICKCGKCHCDPEWSGEVCDCPLDTSSCKADNDEVCSGNGECVCGLCHCQNNTNPDEHRYAGKYCQICMTCQQQECYLYNDCVECLSYGTGPHADTQCKNCTDMFDHNVTENLEEVKKNDFGVSCVSADHSGCTFKYYYYYQEGGRLVVWADAKTFCPTEINLYAVIGGTIGGTVLIGLLSLIIWKILVEIHDKREYEKFERERDLAKWGRGENPLFKTATTTYQNPTYAEDTC